MNELNVNRLMSVLSDILSEKYDAKITLKATPIQKVNDDDD